MTLVRTTTIRRMRWKRWMMRSPSILHHTHLHDGSTTMTNGCTKSFHALRVDQIGKVWEVTLIVVLTNIMLAVIKVFKASPRRQGEQKTRASWMP
jgi:hypothetical protein